jgi:XTP/dITP diphosphohydrolase
MRQQLVVATENVGKRREIALALEKAGIDFDVRGLDAIEDKTEVEETGSTFEENARIKAIEWSRRTDALVLADDSGLEVDALNGEPGVRSARYGGPGRTDRERTNLVLERLTTVPEERRTARFRCVLALARKGAVLATFEGVVEGRITTEPRGTNGFGYDPIFFHPSSGCTTAELTTEEKQRVSHRGQALARLVAGLDGPLSGSIA